MAAVDFITALGRLLHDGGLRDAFAVNPAGTVHELGVREQDRPMLLGLSPGDLEFQARVLLRKRFVLVEKLLPATCGNLQRKAWAEFAIFSRTTLAAGRNPIVEDAIGFLRHLDRALPQAVDAAEARRCEFVGQDRRFAFHLALRGRLPRLHILVRRRADRWSEWQVHLGR